MELVRLNALFYITAWLLYTIKRQKFDCGLLLLTIYVFVAICGIFYYIADPSRWRLTLKPYLYLFAIVMLFFRPYLKKDSNILYRYLQVNNLQLLKMFTDLYITIGILYICWVFRRLLINIISGNWGDIRSDAYNKEIHVYKNIFEEIAIAYLEYFRIAATVILFYFLTLKEIKRTRILILAFTIFGSLICVALLTASRGSLLTFFFYLIACYLVFRNGILPKIKKNIKIIAIVFLALVYNYSINVTSSRFGKEMVFNSLIWYFGESFMLFNYGVMDTIKDYTGGLYFFSRWYPVFGLGNEINFNQLGTHFGVGFITFVGTLYIDFGPVGTLLMALFVPIVLYKNVLKKKKKDIADVYIYIFYLDYLMRGVFVVGRSTSVNLFFAIFIYFILKQKIVYRKK
jgi:oligosaccharide repeat unit polymerase